MMLQRVRHDLATELPRSRKARGYCLNWGNCARDGEEQLWVQNSGGRLQRKGGVLRNVAVSLETSRGTPTASNHWPACAFQGVSAPASDPIPARSAQVRQGPAHLLTCGPLFRRHAARLARRFPGSSRRSGSAPGEGKEKGVSAHSGYVLRVVRGRQGLQAGPVLNAGRLFEDGRGLAGRKLLDAAPGAASGLQISLPVGSAPRVALGAQETLRERADPLPSVYRVPETEGALKPPGGALKTFREP